MVVMKEEEITIILFYSFSLSLLHLDTWPHDSIFKMNIDEWPEPESRPLVFVPEQHELYYPLHSLLQLLAPKLCVVAQPLGPTSQQCSCQCLCRCLGTQAPGSLCPLTGYLGI